MTNTPLNIDQIDNLIVDYLCGEINPEDLVQLRIWIKQSEKNHRYFTQLEDIWKNVPIQNETQFDSELAYQRFRKRVESFQQDTSESERSFFHHSFFRWAAAVCLAFLLGGFSFYLFNTLSFKGDKLYTISVPFGAKSKIELPDKSVVWLNAGSTLQYAQNFSKNKRDVSLNGEAYFEVAKNPEMPFTVKANEMSVKVLGTKFDVRAYPDDKKLDVTLLRGSISMETVYDPGKSLLLIPNERAVVDKTNHEVKVMHVDASDAAAWTKGKIIFDEELFGHIVRRLEREYNVTINVRNRSLNDRKFYGDFRNAQSITEIFDIMTANNEFHYTMKESVITVY
jgi:ferric-dicitrate binding protein FerR (iron transport regulator)